MRTTSGSDWLWRPTRFAIWDRDGHRCLCCLKPLPWARDKKSGPTIDHIVPTSAGGSNAPSNLITLCRRCNSVKGDRPLDEWCVSLAEHGFDVAGFRQRVRAAVAKPLDGARGRELCELYCPAFMERQRIRKRGQKPERAEAPF